TLAGCQIVTRHVLELVAGVGKVVEILGIAVKSLRAVSDVTSVRRDVLHLFGGGVIEINIGVGRRAAALFKRNVLLVVGNRTGVESGFVFVNQYRLERIDRHFIDIEEAWIAFVGGEEERLAIVAPLEEIRFDFFAGREVAFAAVQLAQVEMAVLISAAIVRVKDAVIVGKIRDGKRALLGGVG